MVFRWFKNRRRKILLAKPAPPEWESWLKEDLPFFQRLSRDEQWQLLDMARIFMEEKYWEPREGLELTDRIKLSIAAQACLLILHIEHDYYKRVGSIFVYPYTLMDTDRHDGLPPGVSIHGVASQDGPIALAWDAVRGGAMNPDDGHNVVFHEFAHALDFLDHSADGTPPLASREQLDNWIRVMTDHYDDLREDRCSVLRQYGATNPAEFFAVATEAFFEKPRSMQRKLPELYELLMRYFRQNPAKWSD